MIKRCLFFSITLLVLFSGITSSCRDNDYKTFTLNEDEIHFSFKYPAGYTLVHSQVETVISEDGTPFKKAELFLQDNGEADYRLITFYLIEPTKEEPNAAALQKRTLSNGPLGSLEQRTVTIAGIQGQELSYRKGGFFVKTVSFDHRGLIWNISTHSVEAISEADKAAFELMLETLKIYN
ncbi:MAG: hypothetical protein ABIH70_00665 [Chloroflexota bacterium]